MPQATVTPPAGEPLPISDTYTPVSPTGAVFIELMTPWITLHMAWLLDAIGAMCDEVAGIVNPVGFDGDPDYVPGYGGIFNPTICAANFPAQLPFLGQFVGVTVAAGTPPATALQMILAENGQKRGSVGAIVSAVQRNLSGTRSVNVLERTYPAGNPNADWMTLTVLTSEVVNLAHLIADVNAVKNDIQVAIVETAAWTISELESAGYSSLATLEAAFPSITALESDLP